jgi:hypothetical protein
MPYTGKEIEHCGIWSDSRFGEQLNDSNSIVFFFWSAGSWLKERHHDTDRVAVWKVKSLKPKNDNNGHFN